MSESVTPSSETALHGPAIVDEPFNREEISHFSADDVEAGRNICKMLSLFFFYTVIVMGLSTYITYRWVMGG
jgi:hypothetical protein